jgi:hypothetical protein
MPAMGFCFLAQKPRFLGKKPLKLTKMAQKPQKLAYIMAIATN